MCADKKLLSCWHLLYTGTSGTVSVLLCAAERVEHVLRLFIHLLFFLWLSTILILQRGNCHS